MRGSCDIIIEIDMMQAIKDGIEFYISDNSVILTEGINGVLPPKYFRKVAKRKGEIILERKEEKQEEGVKQEFKEEVKPEIKAEVSEVKQEYSQNRGKADLDEDFMWWPITEELTDGQKMLELMDN